MFPGDAVTEVLCVEKPLKLSVFVGCWSIWGDSEYLKKKFLGYSDQKFT